MTKKQLHEQERQEAIARLKETLKPGDTVHTILRHVSRSGMMWHISVIHDMQDITYLVARALDEKRADNGGIKVGGCGMDMGFGLVYSLSCALYPAGFKCHGKGCNSKDHSNGAKVYTTPHLHKDGGYALRQRWL